MSERSSGFGAWAGLHISGVVLVGFVLGHLFAVHYAGNVMEEGYTFESVSTRMRGGLYPMMNLALLVLALFHGLVGTHRFASDLRVCGPKALRSVAIVLGIAGVWAVAYGWRIFLAFRV